MAGDVLLDPWLRLSGPSSCAQVAPVPEGWEMATGEDGYPYFFKTGTTSSSTNEHPSDETCAPRRSAVARTAAC